MLKKLYYKKNETFNYEFFADVECQTPFDFESVKNIYVELKDGDITPLFFLYGQISKCNLHIPFLPNTNQNEVYCLLNMVLHCRGNVIYTLSNVGEVSNPISCVDNTMIFNITPDLSKYIPEDNAILFLNGEELSLEDYNKYQDRFFRYITKEVNGRKIEGYPQDTQICGLYHFGTEKQFFHIHNEELQDFRPHTKLPTRIKKITIFLPQGTRDELNKANKIAKEIKEEYGIEEVNLFALHWFKPYWGNSVFSPEDMIKEYEYLRNCRTTWKACVCNFNKITTTNSTGILKPQNNASLQVIDCFDIFNDYIK